MRKRSLSRLSISIGLILLSFLLAAALGFAFSPNGQPGQSSAFAGAVREWQDPGIDEGRVASAPLAPLPLAWAPGPQMKPGAAPPPDVSAAAAVILDEASISVLFDKDAHVGLPPASLTKIVTLILALEEGDPESWVESNVDFTLMRGSTVMGLLPGDRFRLQDMLYGLMLPSGNDAALAIGRHISGSDEAFVMRMNLLLERFNLKNSRFTNPHGLGSSSHFASPYDLAILSRYGMSLPGFKEIVTAPAWSASGSRELEYANINSFLFSYPGADGIKTGYTRRAGQTLVASATRNGHRLYAVVLNAPSRDWDATRLLNWAFANYFWPQ